MAYVEMILVKQGVVVFCAKSACGQYKKSYDQSIFSENCNFLLHYVARHNSEQYRIVP